MSPVLPLQGGFQCSRPFYQLLSGGHLFDWLACPYAIGGLGLGGVGMFVLAAGFVGLMNWSEGFAIPVTWLAIVGPPMAAAFLLPGGLARLVAGIVTVGVVGLFIGLYWWFGRA